MTATDARDLCWGDVVYRASGGLKLMVFGAVPGDHGWTVGCVWPVDDPDDREKTIDRWIDAPGHRLFLRPEEVELDRKCEHRMESELLRALHGRE